jgi:hypothetical protein
MPKPGTTTNDRNNTTTTTTTRTTTTTVFNNANDASSSSKLQRNDSKGGGYFNNRRKRQQYIPQKPVTAFDEYLNEVKIELNGTTMSSSEIYSIAYERWNHLSVMEKDKYEREALHANSDYVMDKHVFDEDNSNIDNVSLVC